MFISYWLVLHTAAAGAAGIRYQGFPPDACICARSRGPSPCPVRSSYPDPSPSPPHLIRRWTIGYYSPNLLAHPSAHPRRSVANAAFAGTHSSRGSQVHIHVSVLFRVVLASYSIVYCCISHGSFSFFLYMLSPAPRYMFLLVCIRNRSHFQNVPLSRLFFRAGVFWGGNMRIVFSFLLPSNHEQRYFNNTKGTIITGILIQRIYQLSGFCRCLALRFYRTWKMKKQAKLIPKRHLYFNLYKISIQEM